MVSGGFNADGGHMVVQLMYPQGGKIELIQPASRDSKSVGKSLQRSPQGGLHHITFKVPDVAAAASVMAAAGYHPFGTKLDSTPWAGDILASPRNGRCTHSTWPLPSLRTTWAQATSPRPRVLLVDKKTSSTIRAWTPPAMPGPRCEHGAAICGWRVIRAVPPARVDERLDAEQSRARSLARLRVRCGASEGAGVQAFGVVNRRASSYQRSPRPRRYLSGRSRSGSPPRR